MWASEWAGLLFVLAKMKDHHRDRLRWVRARLPHRVAEMFKTSLGPTVADCSLALEDCLTYLTCGPEDAPEPLS